MRIGIYNGSFDPVHKGHIKIVRHLLKKNYLDKVLIIPTGNYWNKQDLLPVEKRIEMCKVFENEKILVEEEYNELPYTYQLVRKLKKRYPEDQLYLILGADTVVTFDRWMHYKELLKLPFLVIRRDSIDIEEPMKRMKKTNYTVVNDLKEMDISSTFIRENIEDYQKVKDMIDIRVYRLYKKYLRETIC